MTEHSCSNRAGRSTSSVNQAFGTTSICSTLYSATQISCYSSSMIPDISFARSWWSSSSCSCYLSCSSFWESSRSSPSLRPWLSSVLPIWRSSPCSSRSWQSISVWRWMCLQRIHSLNTDFLTPLSPMSLTVCVSQSVTSISPWWNIWRTMSKLFSGSCGF